MKPLKRWVMIPIVAFAISACGDKKDSAQRNLEAPESDPTRDAKGKTDVRGNAKRRRKSGKEDGRTGDKEVRMLLASGISLYCGLISKTTRSISGGESRSDRMCRRSFWSVTCVPLQENRAVLTLISTTGFLSIFWHQCFPCTLLDDA
jgi:hypothetical protein